MDLLSQLYQCHINTVNKKSVKKRPNLKRAMRVDDIASFSLAAKLGIKKGDYLIDVNGESPAKMNLWAWAQMSNSHTYIYYLVNSQEHLTISTSGIPLGVELNSTTETIIHQYLQGLGDPGDLTVLWERYEWGALETIRQYWLKLKPGFITKLLKRENIANAIEELYQGVALYESQGDFEGGMNIIEHFAEHDANNWQMNYSSLIFYYRAKELLRQSKREEALDLLYEAHDYYPIKPVATAIRTLGGKVVEKEKYWLNKDFPTQYCLPDLYDNDTEYSLARALLPLEDDQLHTVCMLSSYRSNGPYDDFMQHYLVYKKYLPHLFESLHVITAKTEDGDWQDNEQEALEADINLHILYDSNDAVSTAINDRASPSIFFLNNQAQIVEHDHLDTEVDFWDFLHNLTKS